MLLRRKTDFPHAHIVTGLFYYVALLLLLSMIAVGLYWQLEKDPNTFEQTESQITTVEGKRSFCQFGLLH